ncbi:TlpA family protein disulfide reductase [Chitinophaga horti]|uniref:TlpA family protein disulfide reductase n=1 Tax=Chitinophaga horti TaxID=2920382 RepID=A0ABY6J8D5_9BACT|nr:TlpA disulfide reductase family protein [Chitinophaga horti]UYQ95948.1 TlpA family protein disulfide reductase [Chitinophaga horti]
MKKICLSLILLAGLDSHAQHLSFSGVITPSHPVPVSDTYDGLYWKQNTVFLEPDTAGRFYKVIAAASPKWLWLGEEERRKLILLSPGRSLDIALNHGQCTFSGTAQPENDLIASLKLETTKHLPFIKETGYTASPIDSIIRFKLPGMLHMMDSVQQLVQRAALPESVRQIVRTEVKYYYAKAIAGDLAYWLNRGHNREAFHLRFIDTVQSYFPVPSAEELAVSNTANAYLAELFSQRAWKAFYTYQKTRNDSLFLATTGTSMAVLRKAVESSSEVPVFTKQLRALLPPYAWERHMNNVLYRFCRTGQLEEATQLLAFIREHTKDAQLLADAAAMYAPVKLARDANAGSRQIRIRPDYQSVSSMDAILAPYSGKVVLIDLWGTWCPPCIREMVYGPALKKRFEGKDVIFLYIARDEDDDDGKWRDFILVNNVAGEHIRMNKQEIGMVWDALGVKEEDRSYPRYVIVDKAGKIVVKEAKRPGDGEALYREVMDVLR